MNGRLIRKIRKEKGYTLKELSKMYTDKYSKPMDKGQLSRYERELVDACFSTTKELADLLDIDIRDLITTQSNTKHRGYIHLSKEEILIITAYRDSSPETKKEIMELLSIKL